MTGIIFALIVAATLPALAQNNLAAHQTAADHATLSNTDIVEMVKAGLSKEVVLAKIRACGCQFDTSTAALSQLKVAGVPDSIVVAMIEVSAVTAGATEAGARQAGETDAPVPTSVGAAGVLFVAQRTSDHITRSSRDAFQGIVDALLLFLKSNRVPLANAAANQPFLTEDDISVYTLTDVATNVGASSLLFVLVDRPVSKWVKISVMCYGPGGGLLWKEESDAGEWVIGKGPVKRQVEKALSQLEKQLLIRINASQLPMESAQ
jgi:hypothetical protein